MGSLPRLLPILATALLGAAQAFAWHSPSAAATWLILGVAYLPLVVLAIVLLAREEILRDAFRMVAGDISRGIGGAAVIIALAVAAGFIALKLTPRFAIAEMGTVLQLRAAVPVEWQRGLAVIAFAVAEELVFRAAITSALEDRFGSARGPWIASALYVLTIVPSLRASAIAAAVAVGCVTAFVVARWRRPVIAMVSHAAFTWVAMELIVPILWAKGLGR